MLEFPYDSQMSPLKPVHSNQSQFNQQICHNPIETETSTHQSENTNLTFTFSVTLLFILCIFFFFIIYNIS